MKLHLARERGSVAPCTKVAPEVRHAILGSLKEYAQKVKEKIGDFGEENPYGHSVNDFDSDDIQEIPSPRAKGVSINMARTNRKRSYDPVDYELIDKTEFWVVEEELVGELDYEELEVELEELPVDDDVECSNSQPVEGPPMYDMQAKNGSGRVGLGRNQPIKLID
ncbi:hypothetical protein ACH5RR_032043 [Cinchona calisaya]|uniref:Uncharacterized protein n=1 Tax=Cinchona calisaya TaxID=153742 RepID=A0ABD2YH03_9GENT